MIPTRITVHCSDSENGKSVSVETIREWHLARGFREIGYHYVIDIDGTVHQGRHFSEQGAHVRGENKDNLGVCLIGKDRYTLKQWKSLMSLLAACQLKWNIYFTQVFCHADFESAKKQGKTCPNVPRETILKLLATKNTDSVENYVFRSENEAS